MLQVRPRLPREFAHVETLVNIIGQLLMVDKPHPQSISVVYTRLADALVELGTKVSYLQQYDPDKNAPLSYVMATTVQEPSTPPASHKRGQAPF